MKNVKERDEMMLEFGKWLMDVAKYVLTAVLISAIVTEIESQWWIIVFAALLVVVIMTCGMLIVKKNSRKTFKDEEI